MKLCTRQPVLCLEVSWLIMTMDARGRPSVHGPLLIQYDRLLPAHVGGRPVQQEPDPDEERPAERQAGFCSMSESLHRSIVEGTSLCEG